MEYLFQKTSTIEKNKGIANMTLTEISDYELASDLKFHAKKYIVSSNVIGANIMLFSY
jgi:hypothetical protein